MLKTTKQFAVFLPTVLVLGSLTSEHGSFSTEGKIVKL